MVSIFSGLIFAAAYAPIGLWFLAPISFALLFRRLQKTNSPIFTLFLFGLVSQGTILHWSGKYVGLLPWLLLTLLQAAFFLPVGIIYKFTQNIWYTVATFLLIDQWRANFPFGGFGWSRIAFSQADAPYMQLISVGGVSGLTAIVLAVSVALMRMNLRKSLAVCALLLLPIGNHSSLVTQPFLEVAAIQGNTPSAGLDFNSRAKEVLNMHIGATEKIDRKINLIAWPENASDIDPFTTPGVLEDLQKLSVEKGAPLIIGTVLRADNRLSNASILINKNSSESIYIKQHLTPFGEYMPLRKIAEFLSPYAKDVIDFTSGSGYVVHVVDGITIGPIICYEIIDDSLVRNAARKSDALLVQTNSATFAGTSESRQQLNITRIRAAEHNREIVSVSTVGISAFIDNNGKVLQESKENISAVLYGNLHANRKISIADKLGDLSWAIPAAFFVGMGFLKRKLV